MCHGVGFERPVLRPGLNRRRQGREDPAQKIGPARCLLPADKGHELQKFEIVVPAEDFIGTVPGQHHLEAHAPNLAGEQIKGQIEQGDQRRFQIPDQIFQLVLPDGAGELLMPCTEPVRNQPGEMALIIPGVLEGDGQGVHGRPRQPGVQSRHGTGIDAAAQIRRHGHVRRQPGAYGLGQMVAQAVRRFVFGQGRRFLGQPPVNPLPARVPRAEQAGAGHDLEYGLEECGWSEIESVVQKAVHGHGVKPPRDAGKSQKRLYFRCEDQGFVRQNRVEKRLLAHPVSGQKKPPVAGLPDGEGEHPDQPGRTVLAPLRIGGQQNFGIGAGLEDMSQRRQFRAQLPEIVDLTVKDKHRTRFGMNDRLIAAGQIDNGQPSGSQGAVAVLIQAFVIRPAMGDTSGHGAQHARIGYSMEIP